MPIMKRVLKAAKGRVALAAHLGLTQQAIYKWVKNDQIPVERVLDVSDFTGIPEHVLRPDKYRAPKSKKAA